jgi:predicted transposase YdaD
MSQWEALVKAKTAIALALVGRWRSDAKLSRYKDFICAIRRDRSTASADTKPKTESTEPFLESTGLLPLAVLTNTPDKAQTLRQVAAKVDTISDKRVQSNVAASAGILAGLLLEKGFINQVLRRESMQQSVIYQE